MMPRRPITAAPAPRRPGMPGSGTGTPVTEPEAQLANEENAMSKVLPLGMFRPLKVMVAGRIAPGPYCALVPTVPLPPLIVQEAPEKPPFTWQSKNWLDGRYPVKIREKVVTVDPVLLITS